MSQQRPGSPDGRWKWDRQRPQRRQSSTPQPAGGPQPPGGFRPQPLIIPCAIGAALIALVAIAAAGCAGGNKPAAGTTTSPATGVAAAAPRPTPKATAQPANGPACQQPCAAINGVTVTVSDVKYGADSGNPYLQPQAGNVYVTMNVDMRNDNPTAANLNASNFALQDAKGVKHFIAFSTACPSWPAINLTKGADSGPKCLVFQAAANAPSPLTLIWTPTVFSGEQAIKLN